MDIDNKDITNSNFLNEDINEFSLRPTLLKEFIGQTKLKENLNIFIQATKKRKEPLDHILFYGPPGLGKTTLSNIIAKEMDASIKSTTGPVLERIGDLAAILTDLSEGDILFIDEIHRMNHVVEETLYSVMEDFKLDIIIGQGPSAKNIKLDIEKFTLIGATTRAGLLTSPLRDRFGIMNHLDFYDVKDIVIIIKRSASILNIEVTDDGAFEIASRSRGTPRIANRLLKRIRDFADVRNEGIIDKEIAIKGAEMMEIDNLGLDKVDRQILFAMIENYNGGPIGIETLAIITNEETDTITDVCEPFLIKEGLLIRTSRGRVVTDKAYKHLNLKKKNNSFVGGDDDLFK
ncbi:MAG: Holliday junction branch migration DNA helicase RuvB [Elusimicrobiota bacterium]|jgi:Holliday junction DNA helicase RuvB|nr:Holliday junction branch migration DNA helicase RuvB [Elusimicrobiota bacterium]